MKRLMKHTIAAALVMLTGAMVKAQTGVTDQQVTITSTAEHTLNEAFKIDEPIVPIDSVIPVPELNYEILARRSETNFEVEPIKAANLTVIEKLDKLYRGYIKAGAGSPLTALVDVYYNEGRSRNGQWGIRAKHFTSSGGVSDSFPSAWSDTKLGINGHKFLPEHRLSGSLEWNRNVAHLYGLNNLDTVIDDQFLRQRHNHVLAQGSILSFLRDSSDINYHGGFDYHYFDDLFEAYEHRFIMRGGASKFINRDQFVVDGSIDFNNFKPANITKLYLDSGLTDVSESSTSTIISIKPRFVSAAKKYNVRLGLHIAADINDVGKFYFFPDVEARYSLFDDILIPYFGLKGGVQRNNYQTLADENPFFVPTQRFLNTVNSYNVYGGFRGTFSSKTTFNARVSYQRFKNKALFVNDTIFADGNIFGLTYENQMDMLDVRGEIGYQQNEKLRLHIRGDFYNYFMDSEVRPWHLPNYRVTIGGFYDLRDKIVVRGECFINGERFARVPAGTEGAEVEEGVSVLRLKPYVDLNLGLEYRYNKRVSAFLNINNIAAAKYVQYNNYPTQRFTVLGGLTWSF